MRNLKFLWILAAGIFSMSCSTDADDTIEGTSYMSCFNVVTDRVTNNTYVTTQPIYNFNYNITQGTAVVEMTGLQIEPNSPIFTITINDIAWTGKDGWRVISGANIIADGHTVDQLEIRMLPRTQPYGGPVYNISYRLDNRYDVRVMPKEINYFATTNIFPQEGATGKEYVNYTIQYFISIDPTTMQAKLMLKGAQFAPQMPALNFYITPIPVTLTPTGYELNQGTEALIPLDIQGTPNSSFPITDTKVVANLASGGELQMNCTAGQFGKFAIKAKMGYIP